MGFHLQGKQGVMNKWVLWILFCTAGSSACKKEFLKSPAPVPQKPTEALSFQIAGNYGWHGCPIFLGYID